MIEAMIISLKLGISFFLWVSGAIVPVLILFAILKCGSDLMDSYKMLRGIIGLIMTIVGVILLISYTCFFFTYYIDIFFTYIDTIMEV